MAVTDVFGQAGGTGGIAGIKLSNIAESAYSAIKSVGDMREELMCRVKIAATGGSSSPKEILIGTQSVDISTGAGALVLDDYLQEMSTVEQAAAQLVAAENKAQKQIHSVTGNG